MWVIRILALQRREGTRMYGIDGDIRELKPERRPKENKAKEDSDSEVEDL